MTSSITALRNVMNGPRFGNGENVKKNARAAATVSDRTRTNERPDRMNKETRKPGGGLSPGLFDSSFCFVCFMKIEEGLDVIPVGETAVTSRPSSIFIKQTKVW